ncbi:MAG: hypothetical protein ABIF77_14085, partial [bacterium]
LGCEGLESTTGWLAQPVGKQHFLLGLPGAEALELQCRIPSGSYLVSLGMMGGCAVTTAGSNDPVNLTGVPCDICRYLKCGEVELGWLDVVDDTFEIVVRPAPGQDCFLLRHVGFSSSESVETDLELDNDRIDRLRALGYVD